MKHEKNTAGSRKGKLIFKIFKAAVFAEFLTVALVFLYAWILQKGWLEQESIPIVNSALKVIGAALTALLVVNRRSGRRWLVGMISGMAYILLSFLVFSIMANHFTFSVGLLSDLFMGGLAAMVTGMLVQLRK